VKCRTLLVAIVALWAAVARADLGSEARLRALALPSRDPGYRQLAERARQIGRSVAARLHLTFDSSSADVALDVQAVRSERIPLDRQAAELDQLIERAISSLHRLADPGAFVEAHVARARLALGAADSARPFGLFSRMLRYDPLFELLPAENSPRLAAILAEARSAVGERPALQVGDLGATCQGVQLIVLRRAAAGAVEVMRFDQCRPAGHALLPAGAPDEVAVAALLPEQSAEPAASQPAPAGLETRAQGASAPASRPRRKRTGLWVGVGIGAVLVVAGVAVGVALGLRSAHTTTLGEHTIPN
jgi:hypothetical protein